MSLKGPDTCFSHRLQAREDEEVAGMERALASFHAAVAKDYGLEEAAKAAEDWIEELEKTCADRHPDWRSVTARAAYRLALRVGAGENSGSMEGIQKNGNQTNWLATLC
jgi:hypothetical protein